MLRIGIYFSRYATNSRTGLKISPFDHAVHKEIYSRPIDYVNSTEIWEKGRPKHGKERKILSRRLKDKRLPLPLDHQILEIFPVLLSRHVENHAIENATSWTDEDKRILKLFESNLKN